MKVNITIKLFLLFIFFDKKISTDYQRICHKTNLELVKKEILEIQSINGHRNCHPINLIVFFGKWGVSLILYLMIYPVYVIIAMKSE